MHATCPWADGLIISGKHATLSIFVSISGVHIPIIASMSIEYALVLEYQCVHVFTVCVCVALSVMDIYNYC